METKSTRRPLTENPTLILISTITLAIISAIAGLVAIWEFFTGENFPQFLARKGWGITMPSWYYSFVIVLLCTVVMLQTKLIRTVLARRRELSWLEAIADEDDGNIENRIQVFPWDTVNGPDVKPRLHRGEPYLDLIAIVQNNTVYALAFIGLEGKFDFQKSSLQHAPQSVNQQFVIHHAERYKLKIRQYLQSDTATQIISADRAVITGGNVAVCCTYKNRAGQTKPLRIPLNHLQFEVIPK